MCKSKHYRAAMPRLAREGAYEGQTIQLDPSTIESGAQTRRQMRVPCWAWWMIWPLIALAKWLVPFTVALFSALAASWSAGGGSLIAAIALIIAGLVLIARRQ